MPRLTQLVLPLTLLASACAIAPQGEPNRLHAMPHDKDPHTSALCMAPNGEGIPWVAAAQGYTCPAPAFFVLMPRCAPGKDASLMDETPEARALRVRFGSDGSLVGDVYQGRSFCMPPPPH